VSRVVILGAGVLVVGINLSAGVFIFVLVGGTGPLSLLEVLFWGGQVLNFVGFGIISYTILSKWVRRRNRES
jgi:membrane protein implicated in regulation of membrane protease activity